MKIVIEIVLLKHIREPGRRVWRRDWRRQTRRQTRRSNAPARNANEDANWQRLPRAARFTISSVKYMKRCARASRKTSNTEYVSNRSHREKVCLKRSTLLTAPNHKIRLCCPGATLYCHVWQVSRSIFMRRIQIRRDILWHSTPNTDFEHKTRKWFFGFCLSELIFFC